MCLKKLSQLTEIKWQRKDFRLILGENPLERKRGDMSNFGDKVQPAVKQETKNVAIYTVVGVVVMWVGFLILHLIWPEKIPFDYRVILGGIGGGAVAVLNFFLMGMAVQKAVSETDEAGAKRRMQASYSQRNLMQMLWAVLAIVLPCFQFAAGILPLLIPGTAIKLMGIKNSIKR